MTVEALDMELDEALNEDLDDQIDQLDQAYRDKIDIDFIKTTLLEVLPFRVTEDDRTVPFRQGYNSYITVDRTVAPDDFLFTLLMSAKVVLFR